jgi:dTMP kinase
VIKFITLEGIEGSGKSTQAKLLFNYFNKISPEAILTREPGGTMVAEEIRNLLVNGDVKKLDGISEILLNFAARRDHVEKLIKPIIASNKMVICDRFFDSTFAYQGFGYQLDCSIIEQVKKLAINDFAPDITFLIDIDVEVAMSRIIDRDGNNRYEQMSLDFHQRVKNGFLEIARQNPARIKIIDGNCPVAEIHRRILNHIEAANK